MDTMIGHNNPPSTIEAIKDKLAEDNAKVLKRAQDLIDSANRVPDTIEDQETSNKITDLERLIGVCWKAADEARDKQKRPYMEIANAVQDFFRPTLDGLIAARTKVKAAQTRFLVAEEAKERKRRQDLKDAADAEARRLADEAAALEKEGKVEQAEVVMEKALVKDDDAVFFEEKSKATGISVASGTGEVTGAKSSLRYKATGEIEDMNTLDLEALRPYIKVADAQKFLNQFVAVNGVTKQIKGAKIWNKPESVNR